MSYWGELVKEIGRNFGICWNISHTHSFPPFSLPPSCHFSPRWFQMLLNCSCCSSPSCSHPPPHGSQPTCWAIFVSASSEHAALQPGWASHSSWSCTFPFLGFAGVFFPPTQLSLRVQIQLHSWRSTSTPAPLWRLSWSCLSTLQGHWAYLWVYVIPNSSVSSLGLLSPSPWYCNDVRACLSSPTRLGSPCSQEKDHFQVWTMSGLLFSDLMS